MQLQHSDTGGAPAQILLDAARPACQKMPMTTALLTIDLDALTANWRSLDAMTNCETAAVVKANGYGLGAARVAQSLASAGARRFFVATCDEGAVIRKALGPGPQIAVFCGHMQGDTDLLSQHALTPVLNCADQLVRHLESLPGHPFAIQLDTGMNRLGMEPAEWAALSDIALAQNPAFIMSHLACADDPAHPMNAQQLAAFTDMTAGVQCPRALSATGGILLGPQYHFDFTRPGIGLYGGLPFDAAQPVAHLSLPVIQTRDVAAGESVGYGNTWVAPVPSRIATLAAGYADGIHRAMGPQTSLWFNGVECPIRGRISMDLITADVSHLDEDPHSLDLLGAEQTVDMLAEAAGTIGYEILTSLGGRYQRRYIGT